MLFITSRQMGAEDRRHGSLRSPSRAEAPARSRPPDRRRLPSSLPWPLSDRASGNLDAPVMQVEDPVDRNPGGGIPPVLVLEIGLLSVVANFDNERNLGR